VEVPELAKRSVDFAMSLIATVFDRVMTSYSLAAGFAYLAFFFMDLGEIDRASFYIHCVRGFLKKCEAMPLLENEPVEVTTMRLLRERFLRTVFHLTVYHIGNQMDMPRLFKCYMLSHLQFKQYKKLLGYQMKQNPSVSLIGLSSDENIDKFEPLVDMVRLDLDNYKNTFNLTPELIDLMTAKMYPGNLPLQRNEADMYSKRMGFYMIAQGAKIQVLQQAGLELDIAIKNVADHVAQVSNSPHFHFCHHAVAGTLALAIAVHTRFLDRCTDMQEQTDLMEKMKLVITAMKVIANKYKIVTLKYGSLIVNAENIIKAHRDHMQLLDLYSSLAARGSVAPMQFNIEPNSFGLPSTPLPTTIMGMPSTPLSSTPTISTTESGEAKNEALDTGDLESLLSEFLEEDDFFKTKATTEPTEELLFL
jgi:hypothetical protein